MVNSSAQHGPATPRTIADARLKAALNRGMIWDEAEFLFLRSMLPELRSDAEAMRIEAMLHAFQYGENEDAA